MGLLYELVESVFRGLLCGITFQVVIWLFSDKTIVFEGQDVMKVKCTGKKIRQALIKMPNSLYFDFKNKKK